jgi:UDPglucose 6-dehydrogenase
MMNYKVGIIGNGFVGETYAFAFSPTAEVRVYDIDFLKSTHTKQEVNECDFVFVCVPTPMNRSGEQDLSYVMSVFDEYEPGPIFILKSTILPGTTKRLNEIYKNHDIVFSPEFLTERTAKLDMLTQARIIFGGESELVDKVRLLFEQRFMNKHIINMTSTEAELVKYMNNVFFATKVSIMNEFKLVADQLNVEWDKVLYGFTSDCRVGDSHLHVPGPDGKLGYGGTCFPKDVNALIYFAKNEFDIDLNTILGGWKTNLTVRPERDWEKDKGRAVSY